MRLSSARKRPRSPWESAAAIRGRRPVPGQIRDARDANSRPRTELARAMAGGRGLPQLIHRSIEIIVFVGRPRPSPSMYNRWAFCSASRRANLNSAFASRLRPLRCNALASEFSRWRVSGPPERLIRDTHLPRLVAFRFHQQFCTRFALSRGGLGREGSFLSSRWPRRLPLGRHSVIDVLEGLRCFWISFNAA